jgi:alpha-D-ribose 1-methylphosphonate 5-triphosphate diphosphatase
MSEVLTPVHEKEATTWPLGRTPASYTLSNVRAVLHDRVTDSATVVVTDGRIEAIVEGAPQSRGDVDGGKLLLIPGLIDVHSDALEKERVPRPSAPLPWDFTLASFEAKLAAAGVTTVFHGAGFHNKVSDGITRRPSTALELCDAVDALRSDRVDHRVLHRFNVRATEGAELIRERLEDRPTGATAILLSHEDHTPGQGQYADVAHFIDSLVAGGEDRDEVTARVKERIAEAERTNHIRDGNLAWAGQLARNGQVRLVGHDLDTAAAVDDFVERGGCVAEFPTTWEAAHRARERELVIVAGAPNVLRGGSHSGNVAAAELVSAGLVDALASDYLPSALLGSMTTLVRTGVTTLPQAVSLLSAGPAAAAGLRGRGTIVPGALADFALVDDRDTWPVVVTTFKALDPRSEDGL